MTSDTGTQPSEDESSEDSTPTSTEVPLDFFGGETPNEGDTVSVKVVSVDSENGLATIAVDDSSEDESGGGIDGMVSKAQGAGMEQ